MGSVTEPAKLRSRNPTASDGRQVESTAFGNDIPMPCAAAPTTGYVNDHACINFCPGGPQPVCRALQGGNRNRVSFGSRQSGEEAMGGTWGGNRRRRPGAAAGTDPEQTTALRSRNPPGHFAAILHSAIPGTAMAGQADIHQAPTGACSEWTIAAVDCCNLHHGSAGCLESAVRRSTGPWRL